MIAPAIRSLRTRWRAMDAATRALVIAGACIVVSFCWTGIGPQSISDPGSSGGIELLSRVGLPCACVLMAAWAVAKAPGSVMVVGTAALWGALAAQALDPAWDTLRLAFLVASTVAGCAALILLLPVSLRRLAVSLLILFHFCGICCAVLAAPPPGTTPSWLTTQMWTRLFRPYLQFVYLNNAYHFYSPDPGPATLLWFRLEAADGTSHWEKIPSRRQHAKDPLLIEYFRRLSLTENASQFAAIPGIPLEIARRRAMASLVSGIPNQEEIALEAPALLQYRPLSTNGKRFLESYVSHVAGEYASNNQGKPIKEIKVYRIVHTVIHPGLLASGTSPGDHTLYAPFFQGTFDAQGNLLNPDDPFLYWYIPVLHSKPENNRFAADTDSLRVGEKDRDYLKLHAGSTPWKDEQ